MRLMQHLIEGKDHESCIFKDKTSLTSKVVSVKFTSRDYAEAFIRQHAGKKEFPHGYDGFWCGMNQSPEEGTKFKKVNEKFKYLIHFEF